MLLITDRLAETRKLSRALSSVEPCAVATLDRAPPSDDAYAVVVCDVALDSIASVERLRTALTRYELQPGTPILCLLRDSSHLSQAQARMAGATVTLPLQASPEALCGAVRSLMSACTTTKAEVKPQRALASGLTTIGGVLGDILGNAQAEATISPTGLNRASDALLSAIGQAGIQAWLDVVWTYDDITYQHCMMVAGLVAAFSLELGLPPNAQKLLSQAALVHDIGKAQIPHSILNKAGPLTQSEALVMRTHPARGYAMLQSRRDLDPQVLDVVRHHHELLDGSGYPDGLSGNQISRIVRMVTICDIYAALVERRSYKKPMTPQVALGCLDSLGSRLDTPLLAAFRNVVRDT